MKTKSIFRVRGLFLLALVFCMSDHRVYALENVMGDETNLNLSDSWYYKDDPAGVGLADMHQEVTGVDVSWTPFTVRDYWMRHLIRHDKPGVTWYTKNFVIENPGCDSVLYVPGVDDDASFYLNSKAIGSSHGYSEDVAFSVGSFLRNGENTLSVRLNKRAGTENIYGPISLISKADLPKIAWLDSSLEVARPSVDWVKDAVIYELYPRSFSRNESFKSVINHVPDLKKMGITVLWIMPIHPIGKLNRKGTLGSPYSVRNYYEINPEYGTLGDFKELVKAVHQAGMHIIIDLVINHTAWDNALIMEHPDWYKHDSAGKIVAPNPDWTDVAQLDYSNKSCREYMINMMRYWVKDVGIDGFRCDVAEMVPIDFWDEARAALDSIRPVMMLAEGARPNLHLKAFDLSYAWNIYDVLGKVFSGGTSASAIDSVLERESRAYPKGSLRLRFNTNHDKNAFDAPSIGRYGSGGDSLTIALIATLPGVPLIYNGDEVGNSEKLSLFEQVPVDWKNDGSFRSFFEKVFSLRASHDELSAGDYRVLSTNNPRDVFAFERKLEKNRSVCIYSFAKTEKSDVRISVDGEDNLSLVDGITGRKFEVKNGKINVSLTAYGFLVLSPEK
jgi:glycosidase